MSYVVRVAAEGCACAHHVYTPPDASAIAEGPVKIALFDIDGTLITSKRGWKWAKDADDVLFLTPAVCSILYKYHEKGWIVALVTNQSKWSKDKGEAQEKVEAVLNGIAEACGGWQPWCLVATGPESDTVYRKPARGLYDLLLLHLGITNPTERVTGLLMCGDAVGADDPYLLYRWSNADKGFASAIGARFVRVEEMFGSVVPDVKGTEELVILMGPPGSGKSTTARRFVEAGYEWIEQDALGGDKKKTQRVVRERLFGSAKGKRGEGRDGSGGAGAGAGAAADAATRSGALRLIVDHAGADTPAAAPRDAKRLVVDATHGSATNRAPYIEMAAEANIPIRILWHIRDGRPFNALRPEPVPEIAYVMYAKHFTDPRLDGVAVEVV